MLLLQVGFLQIIGFGYAKGLPQHYADLGVFIYTYPPPIWIWQPMQVELAILARTHSICLAAFIEVPLCHISSAKENIC